MTTTELVGVIATVLEDHQFLMFSQEGYSVCACDVVVVGEGEDWNEFAAHQARAVLAALGEAGEVQFGVRWHVGGCSGINRCTSKRHAERQAAKLIESGHEATVVSRLTLPWGRAE